MLPTPTWSWVWRKLQGLRARSYKLVLLPRPWGSWFKAASHPPLARPKVGDSPILSQSCLSLQQCCGWTWSTLSLRWEESDPCRVEEAPIPALRRSPKKSLTEWKYHPPSFAITCKEEEHRHPQYFTLQQINTEGFHPIIVERSPYLGSGWRWHKNKKPL